MRRVHIFLADVLLLAHVILGVFLLSGWVFTEIKLFYLATLIIWISCWVFLGYCPLSKLEFGLRGRYDQNIDPNTEIIKHYLYKFFKINIPSEKVTKAGILVFIMLLTISLLL